MIDIIDTEEGFESLKPEWERIEKNPAMRIFQTYAWCKAAWDNFLAPESGNRLWILRWHQEGKDDVVIFPFYIDGSGCLRFIMDTHSDICESVHGPAMNRHWVYKDAAEAISANENIRSVWLQKMIGNSEALNHIAIFLAGSVVAKDNAFSWIESVKTDDFISAQSQLKRKEREKMKAMKRKIVGLEFHVLSSQKGDAFPETDVLRLRSHMVGWRRKDESFLTDNMVAFARALYNAGMCEIAVFRKEGVIKTLGFRLVKGERLNYWIVLYEDQHTTSALYLPYMQAKAEESDCVFDFGVGPYGYKLETYRPQLGLTFSLRYSKSIFRHFLGLKATNTRILKDMLKPRLRHH